MSEQLSSNSHASSAPDRPQHTASYTWQNWGGISRQTLEKSLPETSVDAQIAVSFELGLGWQLPEGATVDYDPVVVDHAAQSAGIKPEQFSRLAVVVAQPDQSDVLAKGLHGFTSPHADGVDITVRYDANRDKGHGSSRVLYHELFHAAKRLAGAPSPLDSARYNAGTRVITWITQHKGTTAGLASVPYALSGASMVAHGSELAPVAAPLETMAQLGNTAVSLAGIAALAVAAGNIFNKEERQARRAERRAAGPWLVTESD